MNLVVDLFLFCFFLISSYDVYDELMIRFCVAL